MMNHTSGYLLLGLNNFARLPFFAGAKKVKIRRFVVPGMLMRARCDLVHEGSGFCITQNEIRVDGEVDRRRRADHDGHGFPEPRAAQARDGSGESASAWPWG